MAIYKTTELLDLLNDIIVDGFEYVDITELDHDDESPTSLSISAVDEFHNIDYDSIDSCEIPQNYDFTKPTLSFSPDDLCHNVSFTYKEVFTIIHAVNNALAYFKDCLADPSYPRDIRDEIKASSVECRNLQAKLKQFTNLLH